MLLLKTDVLIKDFINSRLKTDAIFVINLIEGNNIEYGDFEKCNIDTNLTSKI